MNDKQLTGPVELTIHSTGLSNPFMQFTNASRNLFRVYSTQQVPDIRKVIFQKLHTIVIWEDGEKTVVKCSEEEFDKEDIFKGHTRLFVIESIISKKLDIDLPSNFYKFSLEERMMLLKAVKEGKLDTDISKLKPVLTIGEYHFLKGDK